MLILYSTLGCHLCDDALATLCAAGVHMDEIEIIDIAEDPELINRYSTKIPVVKDSRSQSEICWPFDIVEVIAWWNGLP